MYGQYHRFEMKTSQGFPYWKGDNYKTGGLLVLCESAYNKQDPTVPVDPQWSVEGIMDYLEGKEGSKYERWYPHFERIFLSVQGTETVRPWNAANAKDFLDRILYANYIVSSVGNSAKGRPSKAQWDSAWPPFRGFMSELSEKKLPPSWILIFGSSVWKYIWRDAGDDLSGRETGCEMFTIGDSIKARVCAVRHPSSWNRNRPGPYTSAMAHEHILKKFGSDWPFSDSFHAPIEGQITLTPK